MAGEQDIASIGLDISSFNQEKLSRLKTFIELFNDLSRYDGKVFNPVLGDGLTSLNTSINNTNKLLDEMKVKFDNVVSKRYSPQNTGFSDLSLAVQQYSKELDKNAQLQAMLSVISSEVAKENILLKASLSQTIKAILDEAEANEQLGSSFGVIQERSEEYRIEQERVIAVLKNRAIQEDAQRNQTQTDSDQRKRILAAEYRIEQQRVVAQLRLLAIEQDKKERNDLRESKNVNNLISDYQKLQIRLAEQAKAYQTAFISKGEKSFEAQVALKEYQATSNVISTINKNLNDTHGAVGNVGKGLTTAFGYLRNIAYILPGIGIAGIFNLAYEAIFKSLDAMNLFGNEEQRLLGINTELNKSINEQIQLYASLYKTRDDFFQKFANLTPFGEDRSFRTADAQKRDVQDLVSRGFAQDITLPKDIEASKKRLRDLGEQVSVFAGNTGNVYDPEYEAFNLKNQIDKRISTLSEVLGEISTYQNYVAKGGRDNWKGVKEGEEDVPFSLEKSKNLLDSAKAKYDLQKTELDIRLNLLNDYYAAKRDVETKGKEFEKFNEDQDRKKRFEEARDNISVSLEKNKKILADETKFHDEKENAIKASFEKEKKLNYESYLNVKNNLSNTEKERETALNKLNTDNEKAKIKNDEQLNRNDVEFYQRKILAETEIAKDKIELEAIADEKIFQNEQKSLSERLDAYENYIIKKQKIRDLERDLSIQKGASKQGAATSLTPEEQERVNVHRDTEQFNIQADAEKKNYDITKQYLDERLKDVKLENDKERDINKEAYAKELEATNERFKNKIYQYEAFKKNKEFIDKKYGVILTTEQQAEDDEKKVSRLKELYEELIKLKEEAAKKLEKTQSDFDNPERTSSTTSLDAKRHLDEAKGQSGAIADEINKVEKELKDAEDNRDNNRIKAAKARYEQLIEFAKEHAANMKAIEQGMFEIAKRFANKGVEDKIRAIEDLNQARSEQFELEKQGVEDSSLNAKDKVALDRQIAQEKLELDKNAIKEERKLKHDAAVKEREIAVAQIAWETGKAIMSALKLPPPEGEILAAERGVLGAIQIALLPPVPSYAGGIKSTPVGRISRTGEAGPEIIKEPGKEPYIVLKETISYLPKGTEVVPIRDDYPEFAPIKKDESWEQTKYLANYIAKSNKKAIVNVFKPTIVVDMNFESRKRQILGN